MSSGTLAWQPTAPAQRTLDSLRALIARYAVDEGHTLAHGLNLYRFSRPTAFVKSPAFGVTLAVVVQGAKRVRIYDRELRVDERQYLVITHELHYEGATVEARPNAPYLAMSMCFCAATVARALMRFAEAGGQASSEGLPAFVAPCDPHILAALERILCTLDDPLERQVLVPLAVEEILFRLLRTEAAAALRIAVGRGADGERILDVMQYINAHSARPLRVKDLARHAKMSNSHFAHRFSEIARVSPMRYLREVRLERARELLATSGARSSTVAAEVGFESPAHFTRQFRRRFGVAPTEYASRARR
jgi:AraC-like DNA-binding protein